MRQSLKWVLGVAMAATVAGTAQAQNAGAPNAPDGDVILDLAGTTINQSWTQYTTFFTAKAGTTSSTVTFAFRSDPGYFSLDNVSVVQATGTPINLIQNPGFESGTANNNLPNWNYAQTEAIFGQNSGSGVSASGGVGGTPYAGNFTFASGATGGYDYIYQAFATTANATYSVSFFLNWSGPTDFTTYQQTATQGVDSNANGIDLIVYAPEPIPEPASLALLGLGTAAIGWARRRRA